MRVHPTFPRWKTWPLASQILVGVLTILLLTVTLGGFLFARINGQTLEQQYQLRALGIASSVSRTPEIVAALQTGDPQHVIPKLAEKMRTTTGAAYVVVADREGIRYSHPSPVLIGKRLEEGVVALDGKTHVGIDQGSLGTSANGIAPIFSAFGTVIGEVSVGILETQVDNQFALDTQTIIFYSLVVLALSALGSILLARRIKRVTFGLEPASIASLLRDREALLHGIREGMVGFDVSGRITIINEEAKRLLGLADDVVGRTPDDVLREGRLRDILTGKTPGIDEVTLTDDFLLVVNRMQVSVSGRSIGSVVTVRDRTEVEGLIREVHAINGLAEALRAQEHEYANQLYVIMGLLEMGENEQVQAYLSQITNTPSSLAGGLKARVEPAELAALLLAKVAVAAEHGVTLVVSDQSHLVHPEVEPPVLLMIVGNLVDNAIEALADQPDPREITVHFSDEDDIRIVVCDNGSGVPAEHIDDVFVDGYSTKSARTGMRRGLGLALVRRIVRTAGGVITAAPGPGGRFEVTLPNERSGAASHEATLEPGSTLQPGSVLQAEASR